MTTEIDRYLVNDALTTLAGGRLSDDDLNELTHTVADAIDAGRVAAVTDENGYPIVSLPGSLGWEEAYAFGETLDERFPGQDGHSLSVAMEYNGTGPLNEHNGIASLALLQQGERDEQSWIWLVTAEDGMVWHVTGWCDYTGWDCQSALRWAVA